MKNKFIPSHAIGHLALGQSRLISHRNKVVKLPGLENTLLTSRRLLFLQWPMSLGQGWWASRLLRAEESLLRGISRVFLPLYSSAASLVNPKDQSWNKWFWGSQQALQVQIIRQLSRWETKPSYVFFSLPLLIYRCSYNKKTYGRDN